MVVLICKCVIGQNLAWMLLICSFFDTGFCFRERWKTKLYEDVLEHTEAVRTCVLVALECDFDFVCFCNDCT